MPGDFSLVFCAWSGQTEIGSRRAETAGAPAREDLNNDVLISEKGRSDLETFTRSIE
jgi:hypothetical protein